MKTKIIPFDLETAKKIQAGDIDGKIETREGSPVRLLCTNLKNEQSIVVAVTSMKSGFENIQTYGTSGNFLTRSYAYSRFDLVLEVSDHEPEFKPFDKILVRNEGGIWTTNLFSHYTNLRNYPYQAVWGSWMQCIPYEGNENLLGTTDKPKED